MKDNVKGILNTRLIFKMRLYRKRIAWIFGCFGLLFFLFILLPVPKFESPLSTVLLDRDGQLLGASIARDEQWRFPVLEQISVKFVSAITLYEDRRFFHHPGVDPISLIRAVRDNLISGRIVSGGSTLTMQVVRLSRAGHARTIWEKIIEMVLALRMELTMSKDEILKLYVSHAPFGGNVVGIEAAAWRYFGRDPAQLSWAETAMLAVLPNSPSLIHPGRNRQQLLRKRNRLLQRLMKAAIIDTMTYSLSKEEPLPQKPLPLPMLAPHLLQHVKQSVAKNKNTVSGIRGRTTLKKTLQIRAIEVVHRHHRHLVRNLIRNAAAIIIGIDQGDVLAYVGNVTDTSQHGHGSYVDIIPAPRSTGSLLKPFLYAGMLESGEVLPTTLVPDIPTRLGGFAPQNYTRSFEGAVPAYMALARSLNVPAVRLLHRYGVDRFSGLLKSLGMRTLFRPASEYGLSLILGGAEGSLWDMTGIYAGMARSVNLFFKDETSNPFFPPHFLWQDDSSSPSIYPTDMRISSSYSPLHAASCWLTFQALLEVARPADESGWRHFTSTQKIAWKTGTSYGFRDGWAIGVTPKYAVGVWVGNADGEGRPGLTGLGSAAPILFDLFNLLNPVPWFECPENEIFSTEVCTHSGFRAGPYCSETRNIRTPHAGFKMERCPYCRIVFCDSTLQWQVHSGCEPVASMKKVPWFVLPPAMEWLYRQKHSDYRPLPPFRPDSYITMDFPRTRVMSLIRHDAHSKLYVPVELDGRRGKMVFEVTHRNPSTTIFWHLNENYITSTQDLHQIAIAPNPGDHVLTLVDEYGERLDHSFTVMQNGTDSSKMFGGR